MQIVARNGSFGEVLDHLFYDAWQEGSIAVSGQMEPNFMQEFSDRHCLFDCGKPWVLIHSHDRSLIEAIRYGNALLSKLEGETVYALSKLNAEAAAPLQITEMKDNLKTKSIRAFTLNRYSTGR